MKGRHVYGSGGKPDRYLIDGREVTKGEYERAFPDKPIGDGSGLIGWKPIKSLALAVHPKQVEEARADAVKKGLPADVVLPDGRIDFRTRQLRRQYLGAYGFHDQDGGYGDDPVRK